MNCENDFNIPYNSTYVKVKPFCESSDVHYKVYLPQGEIKVQPYTDEAGVSRWREYEKGDTELATELGKLIEIQEGSNEGITNSVIAG